MFDFSEFKIRLTGELKNHTGIQGAFEFKDGISVEKIHRGQAEMLSAVGFHCVAVDEDHNDVFEVVVGQVPSEEGYFKRITPLEKPEDAEVAEALEVPAEALEVPAEALEVPAEALEVAEVPVEAVEAPAEALEAPVAEESKNGYTLEQLEKIADETGLKGLRVIGDELGIKGKSIPELIERILNK